MEHEKHGLIRVLSGEAVWPPPVWVMRQAGRVLPEYRHLRARAGSFKALVQHPEWAAEATLQPLNALGVDAAVLFSDILVLPEAMGFAYEMKEDKGPYLTHPIQRASDVERIRPPNTAHTLDYVLEAIRLTRSRQPKPCPLIGFSGAPWTLLAYMVAGHGQDKFWRSARRFYYSERAATAQALDALTEGIIDYLTHQVQAGVDVVQLFDTLAGWLPAHEYVSVCVPRLARIVASLQGKAPVIVFAKDAHGALNALSALPCSALSLDWGIALQDAKKILSPKKKAIQGNWDPAFLYAPLDDIQRQTEDVLQEMKGYPFIANLGHGIYPDTDLLSIQHWVRCVQNA